MIQRVKSLPSVNYRIQAVSCLFSALFILFIVQFHYGQDVSQLSAQTTTLERNKTIEREFADGSEKHQYQIALTPNQLTKILVEQRGIDVTTRITAPDGKIIADIDSEPINNGTERIEIVPENARRYTLEIKPSLPKVFAGKYAVQLTEIREATVDEKLLDQARRLYYESVKLYNDGKNDKGIELARQSLEIDEKVLGTKTIVSSSPLRLLGMLYLNKNDFPQAEKYLQRAAEILTENSAAETLDYAEVLHYLARVQFYKSNYKEAEKLNKKALLIRETRAGKDSLQAANSLFSLGLVYRVTNDIPQAEQMYLQVLEIRKKMLGADHLDVANLQNNLGYLYYTVGDYESAEPLYKNSVETKEKRLGADHLLVAYTISNQGLLEWKKGDYQKAESYWKRSLAIAEKTSGAESDLAAASLHNLGIVKKETGNFAEGENYYQQALTIWEKLFGKDNPRTGDAVSSLAILYRAKGDYARAEQFHLRELEIFEKAYGINHPETALSLNHLARLHIEKGDIYRALQYQKRAIDIEEKNMVLSLSIGSERQKLDFFTKKLQQPDRIISLHAQTAPNNEEARDIAATMILGRKGRILDAISDNLAVLRKRSKPEDQAIIDKLNETNTQLSQIILSGPQKTPIADYESQIKIR